MASPSAPTPTNITVRVIANDGKFLGDDIGGAQITIRDADTREILAQGTTQGDSGPNYNPDSKPPQVGIMCASQKRGDPIPQTDTTSKFSTTLNLTVPQRIEITAFGPLAARGSANTASVTTWISPGGHMDQGNGVVLELKGLICQIINPPTHNTSYKSGADIQIVANVAMMCGCPIGNKPPGKLICPSGSTQPWLPEEFVVVASIPQLNYRTYVLTWDTNPQTMAAGRFVGTLSSVPALPNGGAYQMTVVAYQPKTGNTGVDVSTFIVQG